MSGEPAAKAPRLILFLAANPAETARLQIDQELREVREAWEKGRQRETLDLQVATAVRVRDLQHLLDSRRPSIVHFSGHGSESRGEIILLDDDEHANPVPIEPLAELLRGCKGVVLNACSSALQAEAIARRGPWAIGMAAPIENGDAVIFARTFYGKLADGVGLAEAFAGARTQLQIERRAGAELPRLFGSEEAPVVSEPPARPARAPARVELALYQQGLEDPDAAVLLSLCLVTDEPAALVAEVASWKEALLRAPLLPAAVKERARKASLAALFAEPLLRPQLLARLAVTSFSAYAYYGVGGAAQALTAEQREARLSYDPILHRLRKKSEPLAAVHSPRADLAALVGKAAAQVAREESRPALAPELSPRAGRPLLELAAVVGTIAARHLASAAEDAAADFETIRTRLRFAKDIVSGKIHTRDKDPLP